MSWLWPVLSAVYLAVAAVEFSDVVSECRRNPVVRDGNGWAKAGCLAGAAVLGLAWPLVYAIRLLKNLFDSR